MIIKKTQSSRDLMLIETSRDEQEGGKEISS